MRSICLLGVSIVLSVLGAACTRPAGGLDARQLASPSSAYRPAPFWSWNDTLTDEELRWQVQQFKQAGYGGFFMHPRVGLETVYLSDEWFDRIGSCVDEARRLDLKAWLYDEDKWPSGFAGGWLNRKYPETHGVALVGEEIKPDAPADPNSVAVFAVTKGDNGVVVAARPLGAGEKLQAGETAMRFRSAPFQKNNWFNGECYLDILNPDAMAKFLQLTIDGYNKRFRGDYGKTIPGIFMDEPNFRPDVAGKALPWTPRLPELFRKRYGYDLLPNLPALVGRPAGFEKVRHDFWRLLTEQFVESFSRPYGEMCGKLGMNLTGHYLCEDNLRVQTEVIGAAMPHYEYEQTPGIDHLCRNIADALTLKQVASAAHQFGRDQVLCEIFGVSGQDFRFEDAKWIADFHTALGVNYFCPHLTLYSFTGERKRDYPPTFSYHQPYWSRMSVINDYLGRTGYLTRAGEFQSRVLVLHSIASAWSYFSVFEPCPEVDRYNKELVDLQNGLLAQHFDFDYGDEIILGRHGRVEGRQLRVATHGRYDVVVVPPSFTWSQTTVSLLKQFVAAGGKVVAVGETPRAVDGRPAADEWGALLRSEGVTRCENEPESVAAVLEAVSQRDVSVVDASGKQVGPILYHHRKLGDRDIYFFANTDQKAAFDAAIRLYHVKGTVCVVDPATGAQRSLVPASMEKSDTRINWRFAPVGSLSVVITPGEPVATVVAPAREKGRTPLAGDWQFSRTHPNTLVLDVCRHALGNAELGDPVPVWKVRRAAFDAAGLGEYVGVQPWVLAEKGIKPSKTADVKMRFEFESELDAPEASLVVEKAANFAIVLNGKEISTAAKEWHWDKRFTKMPVGPLVRKGANELVLTTRYKLGTEIEDVFLVGDFATRKVSDTKYVIAAEPKSLASGDWGEQGYHFYAGNMVFRRTFDARKDPGQRLVLRLIDPVGTLFDVRVNGKQAATVAWQPYEADITDFIRDGRNDLEITVYGSLRNSFGPLHNKNYLEQGNNWWVGPDAFTDEGRWVSQYTLAKYGLIGGAELVTITLPPTSPEPCVCGGG